MKNVLLFIILLIMMTGCSYPTLNEAIKKDTPYKVNNVIHIENVGSISIVLYDTIPEQEEFPHLTEPVLGIAFFKGSDEDGWENVGPNGWDHQENTQFTIYHEFFSEYDNKGDLIVDVPVIFGEINNKEIESIETSGDSKNYKEAVVIDTEYGRYYLAIGHITSIKGLSKNGDVIEQVDWETN
jgi:hypothetical protein